MKLNSHADLAEIFGVDEATIVRWRRTYDWPCTRVGRFTKYTDDQVAEIIRRQACGGSTAPRPVTDERTPRSASRRRAS